MINDFVPPISNREIHRLKEEVADLVKKVSILMRQSSVTWLDYELKIGTFPFVSSVSIRTGERHCNEITIRTREEVTETQLGQILAVGPVMNTPFRLFFYLVDGDRPYLTC